jgi:hypothetical protein
MAFKIPNKMDINAIMVNTSEFLRYAYVSIQLEVGMKVMKNNSTFFAS